ncbi:MAG: phosphomannomutase/phosphoglucomutase [Gemmatimonadetes bacterium]|nr:phosphomannomutase/phosphoglucomutase [Gemmatimonadota bacterium]
MIDKGIFRQYDIRGVVGTELTEEAVRATGRAFVALLAEQGIAPRVVVGRDNRPSGSALRDALVSGLRESGVDVIDIGIVPTPTMYWCLHHLDVTAGIQVTGSHNPPEFNGLKLCVGTSSLHGEGIQRLYALASGDSFPSGEGSLTESSVLDGYVDDLVARTGTLSRPLKVVADCGNGVASLVAARLLKRIGAKATMLFAESDGTFPNHHPDPTVVENLQDLIKAVKAGGADLGIAFDGDADRIGLVDARGTVVWGDYLLVLYARDVLARVGRGQSIIFDVKCSQALPDAIERAGGVPVMWKTGHSLIKEKMKELNAPIAGEMSGHMFFTEGFYGHDDALYAAARLLRIVADADQPVHEILADIPRFVSTPELRVDCADDKKFAVVAAAKAWFRARHEIIDVDGVRVLYGDGWGLIRASNTQPILVLRFEARTSERVAEIRSEFAVWLATQGIALSAT